MQSSIAKYPFIETVDRDTDRWIYWWEYDHSNIYIKLRNSFCERTGKPFSIKPKVGMIIIIAPCDNGRLVWWYSHDISTEGMVTCEICKISFYGNKQRKYCDRCRKIVFIRKQKDRYWLKHLTPEEREKFEADNK